MDALLRAEDESRPVVPVRGPNATAATRTATTANSNRRDVGGTAGFKKPTAKKASASSSTDAAPESSSRSGFLNFGSFWRRKPEDRSPELTKKPSLTLTSAEKARLFSRLHADPSKSVADPDPEETFRPKISAQSRRMGARVHARENRGMRRVDFLLHKGTEDIRDKNERWRAYDDAPPDPSTTRTIDPEEYFIDAGSGRVGRPGDKVARALRAARDEAEAAAHTFKPKLNPATRALAESRGLSGSAARIGFYERGLEWIERRKRGVEAAARAREDEEERECTFRPRLVSAVPAFMRKIAAKMRRERLGPGADASAADDAMATAANRSSGWLAPAPHYAQSPLWDEDEDEDADDRSDGEKGAVVVGDVRLPSAPADHPATRRASRHVPIKSATSHYRFRDEGVAAADRLEDARLAQRALAELSPGRANANANANANGAGLGGNRVSDTERASAGDYFERLHLERAQRARLKEREKRDALRRHDGSGWRNRVTEPVGPKLGVRPAGEIKSLRRPYTAAPPASLSNSLSNLRVGGGAATRGYEGYYAAVAGGGARRAVGPPGWSDAPGTLTEDEYYESAEDGEGIERRLGDQFDDYEDEDAAR